MRIVSRLSSFFLLLITMGCASYVAPGAAVNLGDIDRSDIRQLVERKPSPSFPARIAVVRVQAPGYQSHTSQPTTSSHSDNTGIFSVVTPDELVTDSVLNKVLAWPSVAGVAPVNRLLLPPKFTSTDDLRLSAARLQADVLLLYTVDTSFRMFGKVHRPLAILSLGIVPDRDAHVTATASALFIDVRTGFTYGLAQAQASEVGLTNFWSSSRVIDGRRLLAERAAMDKLAGELGKTWAGITRQFQSASVSPVTSGTR